MKPKNKRKKWKRKKEIHQRLPFFHCHRDVPLPEEFGEVVATLVAGDRLPPMYPVMTIGALCGPVGEVGGKRKSGDKVREV